MLKNLETQKSMLVTGKIWNAGIKKEEENLPWNSGWIDPQNPLASS